MLETHEHNGLDAPRLNPKNFKGFPIYNSVPTHNALEGTIVIFWDKSTTFKLYVRINNTWKSVTLT